MPNRSSKDENEDINELAKRIVDEVTDEEGESEDAQTENESEDEDDKNPHAKALGRLGGLKGGKARAEKLTPERRREIARLAAKARWKKGE